MLLFLQWNPAHLYIKKKTLFRNTKKKHIKTHTKKHIKKHIQKHIKKYINIEKHINILKKKQTYKEKHKGTYKKIYKYAEVYKYKETCVMFFDHKACLLINTCLSLNSDQSIYQLFIENLFLLFICHLPLHSFTTIYHCTIEVFAVMGTIGVVFDNFVPAQMEVGPWFSFGPTMWTLI